jgi:hypothetical protein
MTRNLKRLVVPIGLAFALAAIAAPVASAAFFKTEKPPTGLTADPITAIVFEPTAGGEKRVTCMGLAATGTLAVEQSEALTISPTFSSCKIKIANEEVGAFVTMNGCDFRYTNKTVEAHAELDIICPVGKEIEVEVSLFGGVKCFDIPGQTVEGINYETTLNVGIFDIDAKATVKDLETTTTNSLACPTKSGKTEVHETGLFTGEITLKGDDAANKPKSIRYE